MLANAPIGFKVGLQGLTTQSTTEAELVVVALTTKKAVFCSNIMLDMLELGFDESFGSVLLYTNNTSALHVTDNCPYSSHVKHIALRYFFLQELVEEGKTSIHYVKVRISCRTWEPSTLVSTATAIV